MQTATLPESDPSLAPGDTRLLAVPSPYLVAGTLSVLMPIFNERHTLLPLLQRILEVPVEKEVILVDDGSTDGTRELIRTEIDGVLPGVKVIYHAQNLGKGAAIRTAIPHATGDYSIVQDGDLEYDPQDYITIMRAFTTDSIGSGTTSDGVSPPDVVYGSRFLHGWPKMRLPNKIVNKLLAWMVRFFFRSPMTDEATCYKAFRTRILQEIPLTCNRFDFCPEVTAKVLRRGYKIVEVPIRYEARSLAEGKKIRWTDGVAAIWTLLRYRIEKF